MHPALIERALGGRIIGAIARDATEIEARAKPVEKSNNDKDGPSPPPTSASSTVGAEPQRKRGRPRKGEERPKLEPTRLERQTMQNIPRLLADLAHRVRCRRQEEQQGL
jgi:hypothetical protein